MINKENQVKNIELRMKKMEEEAKLYVINNNNWITSKDIYQNNKIDTFQTYMNEKKIFWLQYEGKVLFPSYFLSNENKPLEVIGKLMEVFYNRNYWYIVVWIESVNSYLGGVTPKSLLLSDPDKVIQAAKEDIKPIEHG